MSGPSLRQAATLSRAARRNPGRGALTYTVTMPDLKFGALCWNQYGTWDQLLEAGRRADRLGYDSLWTWDH
jgi:alkanesulfonate monooxygenase SsuD/methylene tetrahydromethanopterin reductase-like flavin-dependent oxidoreductase (luciferase family)